MKRVDWAAAEVIHPGCSAAWDQVGLVARVVVEISPLLQIGSRLVVVVVGRSATTRHFDPRVGLWIQSWWLGITIAERASIQWFREQWWQQQNDRRSPPVFRRYLGSP